VPVRAVPWEPNREPADDLRDPAEAIVRASGLPSAPASALREVTHAADTRAVGNGQIAESARAGWWARVVCRADLPVLVRSDKVLFRAAQRLSCGGSAWP
jgi:hypothetical protein